MGNATQFERERLWRTLIFLQNPLMPQGASTSLSFRLRCDHLTQHLPLFVMGISL